MAITTMAPLSPSRMARVLQPGIEPVCPVHEPNFSSPSPYSPYARYSGRTHRLYTYQLKRWFAWCGGNGLDPLTGIQRAHVELYIRGWATRG